MDAFGQAALDFLEGVSDEYIYVESETMEDDIIPVKHLFRNYNQMPKCEQVALDNTKGKVLDVGGGVGSHCLYLQKKGMNATLLDFSSGLCEVSYKRGVKSIINQDFFSWKPNTKYDSILFMMNGIGMGGNLESFHKVIEKSFESLNDGGQILFDSTDIKFCYEQEDGSVLTPLNLDYLGFVKFQLKYKNKKDKWFNWAYYDPKKLRSILPLKYDFEILHKEGPSYCGKITLKNTFNYKINIASP